MAGGRAPLTKTTSIQPLDQVREEERRVKATRLDCHKHIGRNASSSTVLTRVSSLFPERRCERSPVLAPVKPIPTYAATASDPRTGWYAASTRRSPGTMTLRMKWEATALARRLKPCGTDAPRPAGRQLGLLRTIKKKNKTQNEGMTQPPPRRTAAARGGEPRLLPAGDVPVPHLWSAAVGEDRGSAGLRAAPQGCSRPRRGDAVGRRRASPKGITDLARDAAPQTRRDTKLLTHFFLFPFNTTAQAVLRESHVPDLADFFPE